MILGAYYKSIHNDVIVKCTEDINNEEFAGYVKNTGRSQVTELDEYCRSWKKDSFKLYGYGLSKEPTNDQIGGSHYKKLKIQPTEFIHVNNLSFIEGNIIKYVVRHKDKNGIEDLKKARHYIDLLIKFEYEDPKKF